MEPRTHKAIALGLSKNLEGTIKFFSLDTGVVLRRRSFREMPVIPSIMCKVGQIANKETQ